MNYEWESWRRPMDLYEESKLRVDGRATLTWLLRQNGKFFYFKRVRGELIDAAAVLRTSTPLAATTEEEAKEAAIALYRLGE